MSTYKLELFYKGIKLYLILKLATDMDFPNVNDNVTVRKVVTEFARQCLHRSWVRHEWQLHYFIFNKTALNWSLLGETRYKTDLYVSIKI
jgi:hypothetical protein